jgi:hypothetical protein
MFSTQLAHSGASLSDRLALYQVHSAMPDSALFADAGLLAALANPWASVVLSGAVTPAQLTANLAALAIGDLPTLNLAETPSAYWAARAARPWH